MYGPFNLTHQKLWISDPGTEDMELHLESKDLSYGAFQFKTTDDMRNFAEALIESAHDLDEARKKKDAPSPLQRLKNDIAELQEAAEQRSYDYEIRLIQRQQAHRRYYASGRGYDRDYDGTDPMSYDYFECEDPYY